MSETVGVFVSHHHSPEEDSFTAKLVADLRASGADVWVDKDEVTSDSFIRKINEGLAGKDWLVLVMTPEALQSPWVQREVDAGLHRVGLGRMRAVIPIVARPCIEVDIPPLWAPLHRYDATRDYKKALAGLLRALGLERSAPAKPASPTPDSKAGVVEKRIHVSFAIADADFSGRLMGDVQTALGAQLFVAVDAQVPSRYTNLFTLTESSILIVVVSTDAMHSPSVQYEIDEATPLQGESGRVIIPVLHRKCKVRSNLATVPSVSFLPPRPYEEALAELVARLQSLP